MLLALKFHRNHNQLTVTHTAFGDDLLSEVADVDQRALEHGYLHAAVVVEMDVHGRNRQIVVRVRAVGQALGQFAFLMSINVDECCHA